MIGNRLRVAFGRAKRWTGQGLLFLAVAFLVPFPLQASEPKITCQVEYIEDRLTINAKNATLVELLSSIRKKTGIEFRVGRDQSEKCLTVRLGPLPLLESLQRMLGSFSYTFFFGPDDRLVKVFILDSADSGGGLLLNARETSVGHSVEGPVAQINQVPPVVSSPKDRIFIEQPSAPEWGAFPSLGENDMPINPPVIGDMMVSSSTEKMVVASPIENSMTVNPPIEPMHIEYHSGVTMPVSLNPGGAIFPTAK